MHERAVRGRAIARALVVAAFAIVGLLVILWLAQPHFMGGDWSEPPPHLPIAELGVAGIVIGLVWMIRIDRSVRDPERHRSSWRLRR